MLYNKYIPVKKIAKALASVLCEYFVRHLFFAKTVKVATKCLLVNFSLTESYWQN